MDAAEAILRMRELFRDGKGWMQGSYSWGNQYGSKYCLIGAIQCVHKTPHRGGIVASHPVVKALKEALLPEDAYTWRSEATSIIEFNDAAGRTWADIDALLQRALRIAEAQQAQQTEQPKMTEETKAPLTLAA